MNSNKNQPHVIPSPHAHTRASVSYRFFPSPFTPPSHLFVSQQIRCEGKDFFSFTSSFTLEIWKRSILQKNRIYLFLSCRQLRKMRSFRPKAFTQKSLIHNHLRKMSEEVKVKNGKLLCAHYARERPPHFTRSTGRSASSPRTLVVVKFDRHLVPPCCVPSTPFFPQKSQANLSAPE